MGFLDQFTEGIDGEPKTRYYHKNKESGGYRLIGAPNGPLAQIQQRLLAFFETIAPRSYSTSSRKGSRGSIKNARLHRHRRFIFKIDFSRAFELTPGRRLVPLITERARKHIKDETPPTAPEWYDNLSQFAFTFKDGLIPGAHTSPLLLEWYCEVMLDKPLRKLLYGTGVTYARYVDDLVFSKAGDRPIMKRLKNAIREIVQSAGFLENTRKTVSADLAHHGTILITGVRVGRRNLGLARKRVKELERMIDTALHMPLFAEKPAVIVGKVNYLLDVTRGKEYLNALESRTLKLYVCWCEKNAQDAQWAIRVLERKGKSNTTTNNH